MNNIIINRSETKQKIINGNVVEDKAMDLYLNNNKGDVIFKDKDNIYYQKIQNLDKLKKLLNPPKRKSLLDTLVELGGEYRVPKKRNNKTFKKQVKKKRKKRLKQKTIKNNKNKNKNK